MSTPGWKVYIMRSKLTSVGFVEARDEADALRCFDTNALTIPSYIIALSEARVTGACACGVTRCTWLRRSAEKPTS